MANVQHSSLTDPNLHEPKGISTATSDQVYISNGSASGTWTNVNRTPGTGWGQYSNSIYVNTTYLAITSTATVLPFDTNVNVTQLPITLAGATSPLMDLSTETLLFVSAGDMHSLTISFLIATVATNPAYIDLTLYGSSDGTTYNTKLGETTIAVLKVTDQFVTESSLFPVSANMVQYGARIELKTDAGTANIKNINLLTTRVHKAR